MIVTMYNEGGQLDSRFARTGAEAALAMIAMITDAGSLSPGDRFVVKPNADHDAEAHARFLDAFEATRIEIERWDGE